MASEKLTGSKAKHAAKKVAGKAAKKAAKKESKSPGRDMRRGYEHLYRVHALAGSLEGDTLEQVQTLAQYAQAAARASRLKSAADLMRAAEHLAFAALGTSAPDESVAKEVRDELKEELEHLLDRAADDWELQDPSRALRKIYKRARSAAKDAWKQKTYGRALEFARAADAVSHARSEKLKLEDGQSRDLPQLADMVNA